MHRLNFEQPKPGLVAPVEEFRGRPVISLARVRVADVGGEEFDEAAASVRTARGDHGRHGSDWLGQEDGRKLPGIVGHGTDYGTDLMNDKGRYNSL